eukprot:8545373-Alexandrium_andersonii.AAC.1
MSASLVGSEMCIRDRCSRCVHMRAGLPCRGVEHKDACRKRIETRPVSYTHRTLPTICSV